MVPENEFHHKEQPARSATPANQQNGPGSTGKPATSTSKTEEGTSEDGGEKTQTLWSFFPVTQVVSLQEHVYVVVTAAREPNMLMNYIN